jgi:transcriptional regulator GlxA family with amidase domain
MPRTHGDERAGPRTFTTYLHCNRLAPYCREVVRHARVVEDEHVVTAGAVAASLDLGLRLAGKYWGAEARATVARSMHYSST